MRLNLFKAENFSTLCFVALLVIFALLLYLFRNQISEGLNNKKLRLKFMSLLTVASILLIMTGFSIYTQNKTQQSDQTDNLRSSVDSLQRELSICREDIPLSKNGLVGRGDSLNRASASLKNELAKKSNYLNENTITKIVASFETIITNTVGRKLDRSMNEDFNDKVMKNAIFQNVLSFGADTSVLRNSLVLLEARGFRFNIDNLINETPALITLRKNWVLQTIIALEKTSENIASNEQASTEVSLPFPSQVLVINQPYVTQIDVDQLSSLRIEYEFLENKVF